MNASNTARNDRRDVFITGVSKKGVPFDEKEKDKDAWDIENINPLLDAHYECARPGKPHVIADVLMMLDEEKGGHAQISVHGARKAKQTPRKLGPTQLRLIQEWFDAKKHEGGEAFHFKPHLYAWVSHWYKNKNITNYFILSLAQHSKGHSFRA